MKIIIDADACPKPAKEIILKSALRTQIPAIFVANAPLFLPSNPLFSNILVPKGFDRADEKITELAEKNDLVVTADIPLASECLAKGASVINPRGSEYSRENIGDFLASRDLKEELRDFGINSKGTSTYSEKNKRNFANLVDRILQRQVPKK